MHKNLQEKLDEAQHEIDEMQRHLDRMTGLIHSVGRTGNLQVMEMLYKFYQDERRDMYERAVRVNDNLVNLMKLKEVKVKGKERNIVGLLIIVMAFMLIISVVGAQDAPLAPTNTSHIVEGVGVLVGSTAVPVDDLTDVIDVVPTEEAPVIVVNNPTPDSNPSDRLVYVIGFMLFLVYSGVKDYFTTRQTSSLVNTVNKGLENKQVLDESRERYLQGSMENKEYIKLLYAVVGFAGSLNLPVVDPALDKASEWLGNVTRPEGLADAQNLSAIPNIPDPDPFPRQYPSDFSPPGTLP